MFDKGYTWCDVAKDHVNFASTDKFIHFFDTPKFEDLIGDVSNKRVLDLGCAQGDFAEILYKNGAKSVAGLDISPYMIEKASHTKHNIRFKLQDLENPLEFENAMFDLVTAKMVLMYIKNISGVVREANRVLVQGGIMAIGILHPLRPYLKSNLTKHTKYMLANGYSNETKGKIAFNDVSIDIYYRSLGFYLMSFITNGFQLVRIQENVPNNEFVNKYPEEKNKLGVPITAHMLFKKTLNVS